MVKIALTLLFLAVMVGIGVYSRKHSRSVDGFVLGGRNVGPWLTAFAYGTSYFSAVVFVGYAGQFGWKFGLSSTWIGVGNAIIGLDGPGAADAPDDPAHPVPHDARLLRHAL